MASAIALFGLWVEAYRRFPEIYNWVHDEVKPIREKNRREQRAKYWWIFGEPALGLREALSGIDRYITTVATAKHRLFVFLDSGIIPDNRIVAIPLDDAYCMGILSSRIHSTWAKFTGGSLGPGQVYNKTLSFKGFPSPVPENAELIETIRSVATRIDEHRHERQTKHSKLTLTGIYVHNWDFGAANSGHYLCRRPHNRRHRRTAELMSEGLYLREKMSPHYTTSFRDSPYAS
ncbi:MAG: hypothetical protein LIQ31_03255 [Planctomycetes bacterium]|nr:hypothetical protein [Planctomycetota bacterium]